MRIAVILSNYERPELAELCLYSLSLQTRKPDEIIFCDDGSKELPNLSGVDLLIRQEHTDFGKQRLLNKAIVETTADYLVFSDTDCVFPPAWLGIHEDIGRRGMFINAMYTSLDPWDMPFVNKQSLLNGSLWRNITKSYKNEPKIFCGCGSACWTTDALAINGFDFRFGWTGPDYNFGLRLAKFGLSSDHFSKYGRFFHLHHERPWAEDKTDWRAGDKAQANRNAIDWAREPVTPYGIAEQKDSFEVVRYGGSNG